MTRARNLSAIAGTAVVGATAGHLAWDMAMGPGTQAAQGLKEAMDPDTGWEAAKAVCPANATGMDAADSAETKGATTMQATDYDMDEIQEALAELIKDSTTAAEKLADEMRVDRSTVYRWASGLRQPMRALQPVLYGILRDRGYLDGDRN